MHSAHQPSAEADSQRRRATQAHFLGLPGAQGGGPSPHRTPGTSGGAALPAAGSPPSGRSVKAPSPPLQTPARRADANPWRWLTRSDPRSADRPSVSPGCPVLSFVPSAAVASTLEATSRKLKVRETDAPSSHTRCIGSNTPRSGWSRHVPPWAWRWQGRGHYAHWVGRLVASGDSGCFH